MEKDEKDEKAEKKKKKEKKRERTKRVCQDEENYCRRVCATTYMCGDDATTELKFKLKISNYEIIPKKPRAVH